MTRFLVPPSVVSMSALFVLPFLFAPIVPATLLAATRAQGDPQVVYVGNIRLASVLAPVFEQLLASSATFREQCERIAHARYVLVSVAAVMSSSTTSRGSARTAMRRFSEGALLADVDIPVPLTMTEYAELFGHEFEHILEQIDRVNLPALVSSGGASRLGDGAYETRRARTAGLAIADESERGLCERAPATRLPPVADMPASPRLAVTTLKQQ